MSKALVISDPVARKTRAKEQIVLCQEYFKRVATNKVIDLSTYKKVKDNYRIFLSVLEE